jgi:3-hydroxybutyryl-CoA dehydrogenase
MTLIMQSQNQYGLRFIYDPRFRPSVSQKRLVEANFLGRKSGKGFYDYAEGIVKPEHTKDENLATEIFERTLAMLINEAADAIYMNITSTQDLETAMTKGVNYPKGLLAWANEFGIDRAVFNHGYFIQ